MFFCELNWQVYFKKIGNFPSNGKLEGSVSTIIHPICCLQGSLFFHVHVNAPKIHGEV